MLFAQRPRPSTEVIEGLPNFLLCYTVRVSFYFDLHWFSLGLMKMEKPSEFDNVRSAVRTMEEVMNTVNNVLSNPLRLFDASKCVESEKMVKGDIQMCKDLIAEVADSKHQIDHNLHILCLHATDDFLNQTKAFTANVSSGLDDFATFLSQFGFKMPQDSITDDDFTDSIPQIQNGTPAGDIDTSGIQEFDDSPANSRSSNGNAKLNRELNFDH